MAWSILMSDADISSQTLAYTVPAGKEGRLSVEFTNRSAAATATVQMWVVPSAETVGNEHLKEPGTNLSIAGTAQAVLTRKCVVAVGDKVYVQASNANVSCQVSGDVVSPDESIITSGTLTLGSNWSILNGQQTLYKFTDGRVFFDFVVYVSAGAPATVPVTFPAGFRPTTNSRVFIGMCSYAAVYYPIYFQIDPSGLSTISPLPSNLVLTPSVNSELYVNGNFFV